MSANKGLCRLVVYTNAVAATLHAVSALVVVFLVVLQPEKSADISYPLVTSVCAWEPVTGAPPQTPHVTFKGFAITPRIHDVKVCCYFGCF